MWQSVRKIIVKLIICTLILTTVVEGLEIPNRQEIETTARTLKAQAPETLSIKYHDENGQVVEVILKKVLNTIPSSLLPIYNMEEVDEEPIPARVNNFLAICYHGINSKSAITYFPHTQTLHGVIDYRFYIKDLPRLNSEEPDVVKIYMHPMVGNDLLSESLNLIQNRVRRTVGGVKMDDRASCSLHNKYKKTFYAEVLLIIDTADREDHYNTQAPHEKTVMYALAYWNAVDMLFSHLKRTQIRINIAGIAVGWTKDVAKNIVPSFWYTDDNSQFYILKRGVLHNLGHYVQSSRLDAVRSNYDYLIWMTQASLLYSGGRGAGQGKLGLTAPPEDCGGTHEEEYDEGLVANRGVVLHDAKYSNYHTAARVLANLMFISVDDIHRPDSLSEGPSRGIMDPLNLRVKGCLRWSHQSEVAFAEYVNSGKSCCLLNFPYETMGMPTTPVPPVTLEEQCQCYKMEAKELTNYGRDVCIQSLQCIDQHGSSHEMSDPMDGTPCQRADGPGICLSGNCV